MFYKRYRHLENLLLPEEIKAIADERWAARLAKDWATADALRGKLAELGWAMKDGKDGYKLTKA